MNMRPVFLVMGSLFLFSSLASYAESSVRLTLSDSIKQALDHNLDIRITEIQLEEMEAQIAQRRSSFKPKLDLELVPATWAGELDSLEYQFQASLSVSLATKGGTTYSLNLEQEKGEDEEANTSLSFILTQKILPHPRVDSSYLALEKSLLDLRQKELLLQEEENRLKLEVTVNFYQILEQQRKIELKRLYLRQARGDLLVVEDKLQKLSANELDLLNAQMELANAEEAVFQSQDELFQYSRELKDLLGIDPEAQIEWIAEPHYELEPPELDLEGAVREALANRLEIERKELSMKQSELDLTVAKSRRSPSLNLSGGYSYTEPERGEYGASLIFQIPLVDGGEARAEIQEAESRLRVGYLNLEKLKRDIRAGVRKYFLDLHRSMRKIELLRFSQQRYEKDFQIARNRFSGGSITENEVTAKEIDFRQAEIDLIDAVLDYEASRSAFLRSLGRKL